MIGKQICVTGCSGFLGSWVTKTLLNRGFIVHGTSRTYEEAAWLKNLEGAKERLKLFQDCDLLKAGSFDRAIDGCETVIHTASPYFFDTTEAAREKLIRPAVEGTNTVFDSCKKFGINRMVFTSSTACSFLSYGTKDKDYVYTEKDWCDEKLLLSKKDYYSLSKIYAEQLAWQKAKENNVKLSVLLPCTIWGPQLKELPFLNTSCNTFLTMCQGEKIPNMYSAHVDVRDVANAHVTAAIMKEDWKGWGKRQVLVGGVESLQESIEKLRNSSSIPDHFKNALPTELDSVLPPNKFGAPNPHFHKIDVSQSKKPIEEGGLGLVYHDSLNIAERTIQAVLENDFSTEKYVLNSI